MKWQRLTTVILSCSILGQMYSSILRTDQIFDLFVQYFVMFNCAWVSYVLFVFAMLIASNKLVD